MLQKSRKKNRLAGYDYSQPGAYFVTVCVKDRKPILGTIVGADDHIGPPSGDAPLVGADDHIGPRPSDAPLVGADAHIGPPSGDAPLVGADDHIGPHTQLSAIGKVVEQYTRTIPGMDRFVIMPNHVHMILRISATDPQEGPMWSSAPTNTSVERLLRTWKTLITKRLGQSVWQRSYYDHIIRDENDYIARLRYIENNPAKWCEDKYYPGY